MPHVGRRDHHGEVFYVAAFGVGSGSSDAVNSPVALPNSVETMQIMIHRKRRPVRGNLGMGKVAHLLGKERIPGEIRGFGSLCEGAVVDECLGEGWH